MKEQIKRKKTVKTNFQGKNIVLVLGVIYTLISILAIVSYVSKMNSVSNTDVTVASVLNSVWWQILMIVLFATAYVLYTKKQVWGALLEIIMGLAMLVYIVITVAMMGIDIVALIIELVYPLILVFHGLCEFRKTNKKK